MSADTFTATPAHHEIDSHGLRRRALARLAALRLTRTNLLVALLVLLAVSAWLRTAALHFRFWIDEGISVGIASHPLGDIPGLMRRDGSPPLYYLILHVWMSVFGRGEGVTHALSVVFALFTIPATLWAATRLFGRRAGIAAAILAAGVPYLTFYAQETRMYALVAFLSVFVAVGFVQGFVFRRRRWLAVFSGALAATLYSHNWGLFFSVACAVAFLWCVWRAPDERRALWIDGALAFGAVAVLFLPWLPTVLYQSQHTGAPWDLPPVLWSVPQGLYFIVGGRGAAMLLLLGAGAGLWALMTRGTPAVSTAGGRPVDPVSANAGETLELTRLRRAVEVLLILPFGTMAIAYLYSKHSAAWVPRYFAVLIGPLALVTGFGISRAGRLGIVALTLTAVFWLIDPVPHSLYAKSNVAAVARELRSELRADSLVLSTQPEQVPTLAYYLPGIRHYGTPLGLVPDPGVVDWRDALHRFERSSVHGVLAPIIAHLRPGQRVMLVTPMGFPTSPLYMKLIVRASVRWSYYFKHSPELQRLGSSVDRFWAAGQAVEASVWQRR